MKRTIISISLAVALLGGCASSPSINEKDIFQQNPIISEANMLLQKATADNLAFFAPEQMKEAQRVYESALKDAKAGKTNATGLAKEAVARAKAARVQSDKAKYTFEEVLLAREKALSVNAATASPEAFKEAEQAFAKAIAQLELGQDARAVRDIEAIKNQYLAIELSALKKNMLSFAQDAVKKAEKNDLDDVAPRTIAKAKDELKLAIDTLEVNRTDTAKANVHSNRAIWLIKQAEGIADINSIFENADFDEEQKILWYQDQLSTIMSPINSSVQFNNTNKEVVASLREQVASLATKNEMITTKLSQTEAKLASLTTESKNRESQLAKDKAEALMQAQLLREKEIAAKKADDARFSAVQSMFTEQEATVYRQRDNVLIRAHGFSFKSGGSEIESSNFVMLNKITDAIKRFPNADVVVSGHTDATGSAELNLALSKARAEVVANFITQVSEIENSRVTFTGFGKDKPVASNETPEGRAENRRVEILIVNK
ncbi:OmpA family protein [Brumicola blandensis]|uniref:OmpA family protein n=1 Tax=Brumicola blandensis TaxID=3075611 RepID=A0AAW8R0A9_9ALTE|nr:OmpA family protein [Alteromonas sp. W409]MDT0581515.1 OmpA family protein [Alteromonas sp. W409]